MTTKIKEGIFSIRKLASILGVRPEKLVSVSKEVGAYYKSTGIQDDLKIRLIDNPKSDLRNIQKAIKLCLFKDFKSPEYVYGSVKGRSTFMCVSKHINKNCVITVDLKNCFPKTHDLFVFRAFKRHLKCGSKVASLLTKLTTFQHRVPQGAPSSSNIVNMVLQDMYEEIQSLCSKNAVDFSAYVDDLIISGDRPEKHLQNIIKIIQKYGYSISNKKVKVMKKGRRQKVLGYVVNKKIGIPIERKRNIMIEIKSLINKSEIESYKIKSLKGQIQYLSSTKPKWAKHLLEKQKLLSNKPILTVSKPDTKKYFPVKSGKHFLGLKKSILNK